MNRRRLLCSSLVLLAACDIGARELAVIDARPLLPTRAETDERPSFTLDHHTNDTTSLGQGRGALALANGRVALVNNEGALFLVDGALRTPLLDQVTSAPIALPGDRLLASRSTDVGESDLWIVTLGAGSHAPPRALAAARGADGLPFLLEDGRLLFVSTRTGVASIFVVELDGTQLRQLTNVGLKPGRLGDRFVPPPIAGDGMRQQGALVLYDAGDATWSIDVDSGAAVLAPGGAR